MTDTNDAESICVKDELKLEYFDMMESSQIKGRY